MRLRAAWLAEPVASDGGLVSLMLMCGSNARTWSTSAGGIGPLRCAGKPHTRPADEDGAGLSGAWSISRR